MAKKYSKKGWGSLFQVRMSKEEKKELTEFINKFGVTQREFLICMKNFLSCYGIIRNGYFYQNLRQYAYTDGEYKKNNPDKCELCDDKYRYSSSDNAIIGHHYNGYDEENINNVKWLCRRCHGFAHRYIFKNKDWEYIEKEHKKWNGKTREEEAFFEENGVYP